MPTDKNGKEVQEGHQVQTDEAGWIGTAVLYGDYFKIDDTYPIDDKTLVLIDDRGGFSMEPNWKKCEIIGRNFILAGKR